MFSSFLRELVPLTKSLFVYLSPFSSSLRGAAPQAPAKTNPYLPPIRLPFWNGQETPSRPALRAFKVLVLRNLQRMAE